MDVWITQDFWDHIDEIKGMLMMDDFAFERFIERRWKPRLAEKQPDGCHRGGPGIK